MFENIEVFGLARTAKSSGYPYQTNIEERGVTKEDYDRLKRLGSCKQGTGHDSALKGIIVQMDVTLPAHMWMQCMRYHWFDIVSSQSKMHRLFDFDIEKQVSSKVMPKAIDNLKEVIELYKSEAVDLDTVMHNVPSGLLLTAEVTTSYLQLKGIYLQRRTHRLQEWQSLCNQMEELPMFLDLIKRGV